MSGPEYVPPSGALQVGGSSPGDPNQFDPDDESDHIVLGFGGDGLETTARSVGGRTLMNVRGDFRPVFINALNNPATRFTIRLDGLSGATTRQQLMNAVNQGLRMEPMLAF